MNRSRTTGGVLLIALGLLFLLDSMDVMEFGDLIRTYWPLILIFLGVQSIVGHTGRPQTESPGKVDSSDILHQSAVFGDLTTRVESRSFGGGSVSTVFGDIELDLSRVELREGQSLLKLSGVLGSTRIWLPPGIDYGVSLSTVLGDLAVRDQRMDGFSPTLRYQTPGYAQASRTLMITASRVLGDVNVRH